MKFKDKIKFGLKHPKKALIKIFSGKEELALKFFIKNYFGKDPLEIFNSLEKYWNKYRCWENISHILKIDDQDFKKKKILDIGCGYTSVLNILPESERYGIDIIINSLKNNDFDLDDDIIWLNGNAENLPFEEKYFNIIFSSNSFDHYDNPNIALQEIKRVLKEEGFFILTLDIFEEEIGYRNKLHPNSYTEDRLIKNLIDFEIIFKERSSINAQFCNFFNNNLKIIPGQTEIVFVLKKKKLV